MTYDCVSTDNFFVDGKVAVPPHGTPLEFTIHTGRWVNTTAVHFKYIREAAYNGSQVKGNYSQYRITAISDTNWGTYTHDGYIYVPHNHH